MTPLTHHDIVRFAAPLVRAGLRVDLAASARDERRILFRPRTLPGDDAPIVLHSLGVLANGDVDLIRAVGHPCGLVSTLSARGPSAADLAATFAAIPPTRQIVREGEHRLALSWTLAPVTDAAGAAARLELVQIVGFAGPLCLLLDVSTGATMPADARLVARDGWTDHLRATLASGAVPPQRQPVARRLLETLAAPPASVAPDPAGDGARRAGNGTHVPAAQALLAALPDDVLAVLGPAWRPLVWQGTRWKGVLRLLGREPARSELAETRARAALDHLAQVVADGPARYHARHAAARRRVFVRRLRPAMALLAILSVMPLSWLFVTRGGAEMHPLALGLTPLLMVGAMLLSAREIPVLELPPLPRALSDERWRAS